MRTAKYIEGNGQGVVMLDDAKEIVKNAVRFLAGLGLEMIMVHDAKEISNRRCWCPASHHGQGH